MSCHQDRGDEVRQLFSNIFHRYDLVNRVLTAGLDDYLRRQAVLLAEIQPGSIVVDVGSGTGELAVKAATYLGSEGKVYGVDFCPPMLQVAQRKVQIRGLQEKVEFVVGDARALPFPDAFADRVLMGFTLRNIPTYSPVLQEVCRILKPDGCFVCLDMFQPTGSLLSPFSRFYLHRVVPRLASFFIPGGEYSYLPTSLLTFPDVGTLRRMFAEVFSTVSSRTYLGGTFGILKALR